MPGGMISTVLFVFIAFFGGLIGYLLRSDHVGFLIGLALGTAVGLCAKRIMDLWRHTEPVKILGGAVGFLLGTVAGTVIGWPLDGLIPATGVAHAAKILAIGSLALAGLGLGAEKASELNRRLAKGQGNGARTLGILDTSVIIDGRIADVCETGFIKGDLIIPEFVLRELQAIADSSDSIKRTRGRRGLDILHKIQKQPYVNVIINDIDYPSIKEVDLKLINLAKETSAPILTNDFNLNKVAEVHSIQALNMNQLANALKPVVLPGETIKAQVIKEGKEPGQGVAYLDDGTMVVVDGGRHHMNKTVEVSVTSVLQTTAGRMIFGVVKS